jgi:hypothetical protein
MAPYLVALVLLALMLAQVVLVVGQAIMQLAPPEYLVKETLVDFQAILPIMALLWREVVVLAQ